MEGRRMKKQNGDWEKRIVYSMVGLLIFFSLLIVIFAIFGISEWASIVCAFLSTVIAIVLGTVSVIQNKRAEKTNERLAKINQNQLEASLINSNYPFIKFCDRQRIESTNGKKEFVFRFFDIRNIPLKEAYIKNVVVVPLKERFENEKKRREVVLQKEEIKEAIQFTFLHDDSQTGFYMVRVPITDLFDGYRYCRAELEMDLVGTTGVVSRCKYYVLLDGDGIYEKLDKRVYPYVYHQFFENVDIISEQKYLDSRSGK